MSSTRQCECVYYDCPHDRPRGFFDVTRRRLVSEEEAAQAGMFLSRDVVRCKTLLEEAEGQYCPVCLEFMRPLSNLEEK